MPVGNTYSDSLKRHLLYFASSLFKKITFFFFFFCGWVIIHYYVTSGFWCSVVICGWTWSTLIGCGDTWCGFLLLSLTCFKVWCFACSETLFCRPWLLAYSTPTSGINEAYLTTELLLTEYFFFSRSFCANPRDSFWNTQTWPTAMPCTKSLKPSSLPIWFVPKFVDLLPFDRLIKYLY